MSLLHMGSWCERGENAPEKDYYSLVLLMTSTAPTRPTASLLARPVLGIQELRTFGPRLTTGDKPPETWLNSKYKVIGYGVVSITTMFLWLYLYESRGIVAV
jgi:hypothetical protein